MTIRLFNSSHKVECIEHSIHHVTSETRSHSQCTLEEAKIYLTSYPWVVHWPFDSQSCDSLPLSWFDPSSQHPFSFINVFPFTLSSLSSQWSVNHTFNLYHPLLLMLTCIVTFLLFFLSFTLSFTLDHWKSILFSRDKVTIIHTSPDLSQVSLSTCLTEPCKLNKSTCHSVQSYPVQSTWQTVTVGINWSLTTTWRGRSFLFFLSPRSRLERRRKKKSHRMLDVINLLCHLSLSLSRYLWMHILSWSQWTCDVGGH